MILLDTSYLIALFDARDALHACALAWAEAVDEPLVVTEYVLWETVNAFSHPIDRPTERLQPPRATHIRGTRLFSTTTEDTEHDAGTRKQNVTVQHYHGRHGTHGNHGGALKQNIVVPVPFPCFPCGPWFHDMNSHNRTCGAALPSSVFSASHTYRLKGSNRYLTVIEENGRRFYKAYLADRLDGDWTPVADTAEQPFAGWNNIRPGIGVEPWTDNVGHGELVRDGNDETMTVNPLNFRFVFQGMWEKDKTGTGYGQYPWRIGLLTPVPVGGVPQP